MLRLRVNTYKWGGAGRRRRRSSRHHRVAGLVDGGRDVGTVDRAVGCDGHGAAGHVDGDRRDAVDGGDLPGDRATAALTGHPLHHEGRGTDEGAGRAGPHEGSSSTDRVVRYGTESGPGPPGVSPGISPGSVRGPRSPVAFPSCWSVGTPSARRWLRCSTTRARRVVARWSCAGWPGSASRPCWPTPWRPRPT